MNSIAELVAAYRADKLKLPALFDALGARGQLTEEDYRADVAWLEQQQTEGGLDPLIARALLAKLASLHASAMSADADATMVKPATRRPPVPPPSAAPPAPSGNDATVVQPASVPQPPHAEDATVVQPASRPGATDIDEATVVKPSSRPPAAPPASEATIVKPVSGTRQPPGDGYTVSATGTHQNTTGTMSGTSQSSWQHMAEGEADFVTVGSLLKGRFYLEKEIGRGGMGVVYMARDERKVEARDRDPYVAVKVLNDEFRRHPDSLISLQRESRRSQQLAHDNIVRVFDFDKDRTIVFMTMEYIDGSDLKQLIRERAFNGMPLDQARPLIEGMARALTRAHAAGVVHSDFKPANVMVTREGVPKVFDFGIARAGKHMGDATGEQTVFDAGTLGALTPAYASLEMIRGEEPTPSDDVYALGCVAFELLTGKHPYDKASAEVALKEGRQPPPVKGLTKHQYKILCASVALTKDRRLKTANELIEGLREVSFGERARPYLIYGIPGIALLAGGIYGWTVYQHKHEVSTVIARFTLTRPDHYSNENQALAALNSLGEDDQKRIVVDQGDVIQTFLLSRIDAYWNPAKDRYDYVGAQKVFKLRDDLKLYSPTLDIKRTAIEKEKNDLLNSLDTQLSQQIEAGAIFESQADNVVKTLSHIRAIDPNSPLLKNAELELKYDTAIGKSLDAGHLDEAASELKTASSLFPDSSHLKQRSAQLADLSKALAEQQRQEQLAKQALAQREQTLQTLTTLLDQPVNSDDWRTRAAASWQAAGKVLADDPRLAVQGNRLKQAIAAQVAEKQTAGDLTGAISVAGFGVDLFPGDATLSSARQTLLQQQNALAQKAASEAQRNALAKSRVTDLLANPLGTVVWLQDVKSALSGAQGQIGAGSPDFIALRGNVDASLMKLARERIAAGNLDDAERIAQAGQQIDPAAGYARVLGEVASARATAQKQTQQAQAQALAAARSTLAGLSARPLMTPDWQQSVSAAMAALHGDNSVETQNAVGALGSAMAREAARLADPQHLPQARLAVDFGLKYAPKSADLQSESAKLDALQAQLQAQAAAESADAEVKSRIESMRSAAAADDVAKATQSLNRIRALQPDNAFLKSEGPKLLADAYLGLAKDTFQKSRYQRAADVLGQGLKTLEGNADLRAAKARYDVVAAIMAANGRPLSSTDYVQLKRQLENARRADSAAWSKLESEMKLRGQLSARTIAEQLDKLKPSPNAPVSQPTQPTTPVVTPGTQPQPGTIPGRPPVPGHKGGTQPQPGSQPGNPVAVASGADPCGKPELVGKGRFCSDKTSSGRGPLLVVVPGMGGRPYAMSRTEISVNEFNQFCRATGKCAAFSVDDPELGGAPVSRITIDQAKAYARWLSDISGYTYRLPTDAEWVHAAKAGGSWKQADDSNCVPPSAGGGDGTGAVVSPRGRSRNPWGLVNMTGNVWEWVVSGGSVAVRGGSFTSYWSDCSVDTHRADSGSSQKDVGFRILRELK